MITKSYPLSELTGKIIGCAMEVHRYLGNGFQEVVYQRALSIELNPRTSRTNAKWKCRFLIKVAALETEGWISL